MFALTVIFSWFSLLHEAQTSPSSALVVCLCGLCVYMHCECVLCVQVEEECFCCVHNCMCFQLVTEVESF